VKQCYFLMKQIHQTISLDNNVKLIIYVFIWIIIYILLVIQYFLVYELVMCVMHLGSAKNLNW